VVGVGVGIGREMTGILRGAMTGGGGDYQCWIDGSSASTFVCEGERVIYVRKLVRIRRRKKWSRSSKTREQEPRGGGLIRTSPSDEGYLLTGRAINNRGPAQHGRQESDGV